MYPYALDGIEDKGNILGKKEEEELCLDLSKIIINGKAGKRVMEWKKVENVKRIKKDSREIKKELIDNERKFKKIRIN
jgi:hypothetical protein